MRDIAKTMLRRLAALSGAKLVSVLLVLAVSVSVFLLAATKLIAQDSPEVEQLKQKAQQAFLKSDYAAAAAFDLEIAGKHPGTEARRYAVQMLGTIYETNLVDLKKAIKWDREFLGKYADSRQVPVYKEKLASLEKLLGQEQAFKSYQSILFANAGDEIMAKKLEALLKEHPDFLLKDQVLSELGYAYGRMDERKKSALAFQAIASQGENKLSTSDKGALENASRYWRMRTTWAWVAWTVIVVLWAVVLLMNPWKQLTLASIKKFLLWPVLWVLLTAASMPLFYSLETVGYPIVIPLATVLIAAALNLIVLFWVFLLIQAKVWRTRPRALRWLSPVLALLMTTGVFYLFVVYQPNGPFIVDVCVVKYEYWQGELREWSLRHRTQTRSAVDQGNRSAELTEKTAGAAETVKVGKESK